MASERDSGKTERGERERRLAEALRANLRRRKAQARARKGTQGREGSNRSNDGTASQTE